jgi:hypothetical protein
MRRSQFLFYFLLIAAACLFTSILCFENKENRQLEAEEATEEDKAKVQLLREEIKQKRKNKKKKDKSKGSPERQAIVYWADSLTEKDYNHTEWRLAFHSSSASDFFNGYARRISDIFKSFDAKVNFVMVGACDGTGDKTIKKLYIPNSHWRGVFVEPMSINVRDLIKFMANQNAAHRSLIIRAAATSHCENNTIKIERPLYEEKNASIPHWLRRQIGSILPEHRNHPRKEWTIEEVRCITAKEVLRDWAASSASYAAGGAAGGGGGLSPSDISASSASNPSKVEDKSSINNNKLILKKTRVRKPHVLKIDVEGHDFEVSSLDKKTSHYFSSFFFF